MLFKCKISIWGLPKCPLYPKISYFRIRYFRKPLYAHIRSSQCPSLLYIVLSLPHQPRKPLWNYSNATLCLSMYYPKPPTDVDIAVYDTFFQPQAESLVESTLTINSVTLEDSGVYSCASSDENDDLAKGIRRPQNDDHDNNNNSSSSSNNNNSNSRAKVTVVVVSSGELKESSGWSRIYSNVQWTLVKPATLG